ncbi:MAG: lipopolysaccharide biosynthesis protein, partial [Cryomorphaceae bacterium]
MSRLLKYFTKSDFAKNVGVMFSGNAVAMVLPFILAPLISRIYQPEDFAGFELFVKIMGLIVVVGSLRLDLAILIPKSKEEAMAVVRLSFKILLGITLFTGLIFIGFRDFVGELLQNEDLPGLMWFLPFAVFTAGAFNIFTQYIIRIQDFKEAAFNKISTSAANNGTKYLLGFSIPQASGLVIGHIFGAVVPLMTMLRKPKIKELVKSIVRPITSDRKLLKKYRDFPLISSSHAFFHEGQQTVLIAIISAYYGELIFGLFAFSMRYLRVPLMVFGKSIAQVLNEKWARELNEGVKIKTSVVRILLLLAAVAVIPFTVLFFFGKPIFAFVFGEVWADAGTYAEIMAPWLFLNFVVSPITMLPILLNRQPAFFRISLVTSALT